MSQVGARDRRSAGAPEVVCLSVTSAGQGIARRLPYRHRHGALATTVAEEWSRVDALVVVAAVGLVVRVVAPHLRGKGEDPAVVCVDGSSRWAIPVLGGHAAGANDLAREIAALLGAEPVVTTATEVAGLPALDLLGGFAAEGDVAAVTRRLLDEERVTVANPAGWPLPAPLAERLTPVEEPGASADVAVTDLAAVPGPGRVVLHPPSLVAGIGASAGAPADEIAALVERALDAAGLDRASLAEAATLDVKAAEPGITALGLPLRSFPAERLAEVPVPNPSTAVARAVGTPSVAEAAALLAAGPGATLVLPKQRSAMATVAVARRAGPAGRVAVVGLGPGAAELRTPAASSAIRHADVVIGYERYVDLCSEMLDAHQEVVRSPIGAEEDRCREALVRAAAGQRVALVCSGDPGVYAMASLVLELAGDEVSPEVAVVPGVSAAQAAAALLGAPLGHDHAVVSLSDLLTPWSVIEARLEAAARGDYAVVLYNPRSAQRSWQLARALEIFRGHRAADTPAAVVNAACRPGQSLTRTTLAQLDPGSVGMTACVIVGATATRWIGERMVTPRGYMR